MKNYKKILTLTLGLALNLITFFVLYPAVNRHAMEQTSHYKFYFNWELHIPLIAEFVIIYNSIYLTFFLIFYFFSTLEIAVLGLRIFIALLLGNLVHFLLPAPLGFVRETVTGPFAPAFEVLYAFDLPANTLPSLHIAIGYILFISLFHRVKSMAYNGVLFVWFILVCLSVLFTHQHHVLDIVTGLILGFLVNKIPLRNLLSKHFS